MSLLVKVYLEPLETPTFQDSDVTRNWFMEETYNCRHGKPSCKDSEGGSSPDVGEIFAQIEKCSKIVEF